MELLDDIESLINGEYLEDKGAKWDHDLDKPSDEREIRKHNLKVDFDKALTGNKAAALRVRNAMRLLELKAKEMRQKVRPNFYEDEDFKQEIREYKLKQMLDEDE